jgi:hypothetical protein
VSVPLTDDRKTQCPFHSEERPSLQFYADHFHCFGCGEHGDRIDWLTRGEGLSHEEAIALIWDWDGPVAPRQPTEESKTARALELWTQGVPIAGTLAERYLRETRGIDVTGLPANSDNLRFLARCPFGTGPLRPCLLALMRDPENDQPTGIQRIALELHEGRVRKIDRFALGPIGAIKLWPAGSQLVVGEGLETTLAAATRIPYRGAPLRPAWSAVSSGGLSRFPAISGVERLIVLVDHDANGEGLVMGGEQGIGKDTLLEPVKQAVGPWNFREVIPANLLGRFNSFLKVVILRVNEGRDLGEAERINRFTFYDHTKIYTAAPPDVLRVDEKHLREYYVFNVLGFLLTTNYKTDGIYLPPDDRRHYVAWSKFKKEDFKPEYWNGIWSWYHAGGFEHVAAYLAEFDLSGFDPKAPPPQTPAFWEIVGVNRPPEDAELADAIDLLGKPNALTIKQIIAAASGALAEWMSRSRRAIPHRLERCGYVSVKNPNATDGYWLVGKTRQPIYARVELPHPLQEIAAQKLCEGGSSRA